ncbi:MAG TPA: M48 family metallopeptidase [Thermoanaerobaculia bacterium]|nr:M48 family metallopeptidase [Thermoanaerobaculia bacterium]
MSTPTHRHHDPSHRALAAVLAAVLALSALLAAACASSGVNQGDFNLVSLEEEWRLGQQLERDLAQKLRLVNDRAALSYVNRVGQRIVNQTEMRNLPWKFHIVADPEINAFNIPGGHVYVNTGLIGAADNVSEFTGVLAHEISHGVARHGTEQLTRSYGLSIVAGLVLGENPAVYQQILAQIVGTGALAKFSRNAEREADRLGVTYMARAGYDPMGMATMFEELLRRRGSQPGAVGQFFATHPLTEERIRDVRAQAQGIDRSRLASRDQGYQNLRQRVGP